MRHSGGEVSDCQVIGRHWVAMGSKMMGEHPRTGRVDGEQAKESGPGLSSWEVAGSGPVAPPVGADSERNTGADDPCPEARLGSGVPARQVEAGEAPLQQALGRHRRLAGESGSAHDRARAGRGRNLGAAPLGVAENWCRKRTISTFDEFKVRARRKSMEVNAV